MRRPKPFTYHTLLRVRTRKEETASQQLAQLQRRIQHTSGRAAQIRGIQEDLLSQAAQQMRDQFTVRDVQQFYQYEQHMARQALEADADLRRLQHQENVQQAELQEAVKQRRVVENLKDRRDRQMRVFLEKTEQRIADETAVNRSAQTRQQSKVQ